MKKWNVAALRAAKGKTKLGCVTAYDACFARLADEAGVPIVLVGDSQGMNCLGYETTLPVNMSDTLAAVAAVARGAKDALVVGDMPFGSYQCGDDEAVKTPLRSSRLVQPPSSSKAARRCARSSAVSRRPGSPFSRMSA